MKNWMIIFALSLGFGSAFAQKLKETEVPAIVKENFNKQFPNTKVDQWEKEGVNYEAEFHINKVENSITFNANGVMTEMETEIQVSELPKKVSEYVEKNLVGKKIKEASRITDATGVGFYEAEIDGADYMFDDNGSFIKKITEAKEDKK
jgi:hypothetical protein